MHARLCLVLLCPVVVACPDDPPVDAGGSSSSSSSSSSSTTRPPSGSTSVVATSTGPGTTAVVDGSTGGSTGSSTAAVPGTTSGSSSSETVGSSGGTESGSSSGSGSESTGTTGGGPACIPLPPDMDVLCHDGVVAGGELCYELMPSLDDLGVTATGVFAGDVDGDMDADIVAVLGFPASLAVMLGDGLGNVSYDGTYPLDVGADGGADDVAFGDMDGDGWVDAVVAFESPPSLRVLLNDGTGAFGPPGITMLLDAPLAVEVVDFDLDGDQDAIVSDDAGVWIHYGLGNGSFGMATGLSDPALVGGRDLGLEDFDGDGNLDVAVAFTQTVAVFLGDGLGGLSMPWTLAVPASAGGPQELAIGDVTDDGVADILVADRFVDQIHELSGVGNGTFVLQPMPRTGAFVLVGEGNSDCETDIYTRTDPMMSDVLTIYPSDGMGGYDVPQDFEMHDGMADMALADFNGDGLDDVVFVIGFSGEVGLSAAEP